MCQCVATCSPVHQLSGNSCCLCLTQLCTRQTSDMIYRIFNITHIYDKAINNYIMQHYLVCCSCFNDIIEYLRIDTLDYIRMCIRTYYLCVCICVYLFVEYFYCTGTWKLTFWRLARISWVTAAIDKPVGAVIFISTTKTTVEALLEDSFVRKQICWSLKYLINR